VQFINPKSMSFIRTLFPGAHLEIAMGDYESNKKYCSKDDSKNPDPLEAFREHGTPKDTKKQGKRNDIGDALKAIKEGEISNEAELLDLFPVVWAKYANLLNRALATYKKHDNDEYVREHGRGVYILYGKTGVGKTRAVMDKFGADNVYRVPSFTAGGTVWFNGLGHQDVVLFDEFSGEVPIGFILQLTDFYPNVQVQTKGGFIPWCPKTVVFTSNVDPENWWALGSKMECTTEQRAAFKRRWTAEAHEMTEADGMEWPFEDEEA